MNCFQNCIFIYYSQHWVNNDVIKIRCELLSKLYLYILFATGAGNLKRLIGLWIAFKIVSLYTIRNCKKLKSSFTPVVNCFQNCIFIYYSQQFVLCQVVALRCELLSKLYLYILFATPLDDVLALFVLWIAFKIVSLYTIRNMGVGIPHSPLVVNCFQNCIFIYYSQLSVCPPNPKACCELLSKLYLYILFATYW